MDPPAIGIDLGTTNSCAAVYRDGRAEVIETADEQRTTPSFVYYDDDEVVVGEEAEARSAIKPHNGVFDAKRLLGRKFGDAEVQNDMKLWPFTVVRNTDDEPLIELSRRGRRVKVRPEEVSAEVLRQLKADVSRELGEDVASAVITVPAYFSTRQKEATRNAARMAGLDVLQLITEPTAAALAFTHGAAPGDRLVLVYDLGGGTFDVSLIRFAGETGDVVAVSGDTHLGGRDFDNNLLRHVMAEIRNRYGLAVVDPEDRNFRRALRRLRPCCEKLKKELSKLQVTELTLDEFYSADVLIRITREQFEQLNDALFALTVEITDAMLREAGVGKGEIDDVILVGGSTRIPRIQAMVRAYFGKAPNVRVNPDEAVAVGAAIQAALLGRRKIADVTPLSVGVGVAFGRMSALIPRGTKIPVEVRKTYCTFLDNQTAVSIPVFEGESEDVARNVRLGEIVISDIPAKPAGEVPLYVTLKVDDDGILTVQATETERNLTGDLQIKLNTHGLTEQEIREMIRRSDGNKAEAD